MKCNKKCMCSQIYVYQMKCNKKCMCSQNKCLSNKMQQEMYV